MHVGILTLSLIGLAAFWIWGRWRARRDLNRQVELECDRQRAHPSEGIALQQQLDFEAYQRIRTPDAIRGKQLYVYRALMAPWFAQFHAANRYNDQLALKIRRDWIEYLEALRDFGTSGFLEMMAWEKGDQKQKEDNHRQRKFAEARMVTIENTFASGMGAQAVALLNEIRARDYNDFLFFDWKTPVRPDGKLEKIVASPVSVAETEDGSNIVPSNSDRRPCPHCAEMIMRTAKVCRFCNRELYPLDPGSVAQSKHGEVNLEELSKMGQSIFAADNHVDRSRPDVSNGTDSDSFEFDINTHLAKLIDPASTRRRKTSSPARWGIILMRWVATLAIAVFLVVLALAFLS